MKQEIDGQDYLERKHFFGTKNPVNREKFGTSQDSQERVL
jgi:hypothetical protein